MDKIDNLDRKILDILSKNARVPFKDVAAVCGVSRAAIHQRVQHLVEVALMSIQRASDIQHAHMWG